MSNNSYYNDQWRIINEKNQNKVSNYSMEFNALSGDTIQLNNAGNSLFNNATAFTISAWINPLDNGASQNILTNYGNAVTKQNVMLRFNATEALQFYVSTTNGVFFLGTSNNVIQYNQWQHIVATYDGVNSKIYYNATLSNSIAATGFVSTSTEQDQIGWRAPYGQYFSGKMDQVCVFDYALPATGTNSVATLYGGGTAVTNPMSLNPVAYYQLGDQSAYNGANYLVPNNSLDGFVFRSVPAQTTAAIPPNTITSNINYTGTPASPSGFTVSFWVKGIGPFGSNQEQLIFDHSATTFTTATAQGVFSFQSGSILLRFGNGTYRYYTIPSGIDFDDWNNIVVYFQPGNRSAGKVWINGGTPLALATGGGSSYNDFTSGFRLYLNSFNSNVMYFKNYEIDNAGAALLYNNGSPLSNTSTLAQAPNHWWRLNADDTFDSGTSTWTIKDYIGTSDGTSVNMTSNNLVISDLSNTGGASGYSPYALNFDGINDNFPLGTASSLNFTGDLSISFWIKTTDTRTFVGFAGKWGNVGFRNWLIYHNNGIVTFTVSSTGTTAGNGSITGNTIVNDGNWHHVLLVNDSTTTNNYIYIDGIQDATANVGRSIVGSATTGSYIARYALTSSLRYLGDMSNFAFWNTVITPEQVNEIYNSGRPSNLNNFSGATPVHWWQFGSNSSFNSNAWTCLDEMGTLNAVSEASMANDDIVNGVGYSGNGLGTSSIDIVGDAPYSTANGLSVNMDVLDRSTDVPS